MLVVYLGVLGQNDRFGLQRFSQLAKDVGTGTAMRVAAEDLPSIQSAWAELAELAADGQKPPSSCRMTAYVLRGYMSLLYQRIGAGSRLLVNINPNTLERQNAFLSRFDLTGTQVRIRSSTSHLIVLDRSAGAFRDFRLFGGVDQVQIQQPNAIWYGGDSLPVLVADGPFLTVNAETDLPSEWNARELACIAAWHGAGFGGVLAVSGNFFGDPYDGPTGLHWPGIEANEQLAQNVMQYLIEGRARANPEDRCQRVEINLADFVFGVLKRSDDDWWNKYVPLPIRQKCAQRQEEELNRLPKEGRILTSST